MPTPQFSTVVKKSQNCGVAGPPYRHRFLYRQPLSMLPREESNLTPYDEVIELLFPSSAFTKWLALVARRNLTCGNIVARRFRRGKDYTLKPANLGFDTQLEVCLNITATTGWSGKTHRPSVGKDQYGNHDIAGRSGFGGQELYATDNNDDSQVHRVSVVHSADQKDKTLLNSPMG